MKSLQELHKKRGRSFRELYAIVTSNILSYHRDGDLRALKDHYPIIEEWVEGFHEKYTNWIPEQADYLSTLYGYNNGKKSGSLFTLCALAFLHIAHDLPVTISQSLLNSSNSYYTRSVCDLNLLKSIYNELESPLSDAIRASWKKPFFAWAALLWKNAHAELFFMLWILALRNKAWDDGISLYCNLRFYSNPIIDPYDQLKLQVIEAMKIAQKESKILFYKRILRLRLLPTALLTGGAGLYFLTYSLSFMTFYVLGATGVYAYTYYNFQISLYKKIFMSMYESLRRLRAVDKRTIF